MDEFAGRPFRTTEARVYVMPGHPLLVPIVLAPGVSAAGGIAASLDDGTPCPSSLWRVGVSARSPVASRASIWMAGTAGSGPWGASSEVDAAIKLPVGSWIVAVDLPAGADRASDVRFDGIPVPLTWISAETSPGQRLLDRAAAAQWGSVSDQARALLPAILLPALESPLARWRPELAAAAAGLPIPRRALGQDDARVQEEQLDVLSLLAAQTRARWEAGLTRLHAIDEPLAVAVAHRLVASIRFDGITVPAWPAETPDLDRLLDSLLDPRQAQSEVADAARNWFGTQPRAVAWVLDDAGEADAQSGEPLALAALANLSPESQLCWARPADGTAPRLSDDLVRVAPWSVVTLSALCRRTPDAASPLSALAVRIGPLRRELTALAEPMQALPPGLTTSGFLSDWNCTRWLAAGAQGQPPVPAFASAPTAARLIRSRTADGQSQWRLFLDCQEQNVGAPASGYVRIWLGPRGHPTAVWRIEPDGSLFDETDAARSGRLNDPRPSPQPSGALRSVPTAGGWQVLVPIPESALTPPAQVRLGLERQDAAGEHSAWPRAMLPWQLEPGRALIDTTAWEALNLRLDTAP